MGLVQPTFQRQIDVSVGCVGKLLECTGASGAAAGSGWLSGSMGSMRAKMEVDCAAGLDAAAEVLAKVIG